MANPRDPLVEPEPERLRLASGRVLAYDLITHRASGHDSGQPVLVLHGTPDSRLATPPQPEVAGVVQVVVDRPGFGDSDVDPMATPTSVADDLADLCAQLRYEQVGVMAWSAGALFALALAERHPNLIGRLVLAAPLAPADSWEATAPDRYRFDVDDIEFIVEFLVPAGIDLDAATAIALGDDAARRREVDSVPGAAARLGRAVLASVQSGQVGLQRDLAAQLVTPDLASIATPCHVVVGAADATCPPAMGRWLAERMTASDVTVEEVLDAGHAFPLIRWTELVSAAASPRPARR